MSISFSYALDPPAGVEPVVDGAPAVRSDDKSFKIEKGDGPPVKAYYDGASAALRTAQDVLNDTFTVWKEAIGEREKHKEVVKEVKGMGKTNRLMAANKAAEAHRCGAAMEDSDEDGVDLAEAG